MADAPNFRTIYIGQILLHELGLATSAAHALGFVVESTYGPGKYADVTQMNKEITVDVGHNGVVLSYPEGKDAGTFWGKFFELKGTNSPEKEKE